VTSSIGQAFAQVAETYPDSCAIVYGQDKISYRTLLRNANQLTANLAFLDFQSGDCIAVLLPNCPEFLVSFYGITNLGAVALPTNHLYQAEEVKFYLADSGVKAIITDSSRALLCKEIIAQLNQPIRLIITDRVLPETLSFQALLQPCSSVQPLPTVSPHQEALYLYSSGSTGRPKRVPRTHKQLLQEVESLATTIKLNPNDAILCLVPLYHAHGLGNCLLAATCNGATLVLLEPILNEGVPVEVPFMFRCPRVFQLLEQENITILPAVPYIFKALAATQLTSAPDLSKLRLIFSAGNFLAKEIFDTFKERFALAIRQLYGCTEAGAIALNVDNPTEETWNSVGRPLKNVDVSILDEQGNLLPPGTVGEVVVSSKALTQGYSNRPELNHQVFKDGAYFTGDLGKLDDKGRLYITGRKKILIDTGGRKVDPIEIEDVLLTHPAVQEAVVVGVKGNHAGEIIKAALVVTPSIAITQEEIFGYCKGRLADFKMPKIIEFREEIPKSPLGKILRKALV
jgi:long-chain acyl-CoA synthetase